MRLHPSNCFPLERVVPQGGAVICGINIPEGTIISTSAPLINCIEEIFGQDAHQFHPERWLEASPEQLKIMERNYFTVSDTFLCSLNKLPIVDSNFVCELN